MGFFLCDYIMTAPYSISLSIGEDLEVTDTEIFLNEAFSTQCISVPIMNDGISEPDETFTVTLMGIPDVTPPNVVFTRSMTTVTVIDDDGGNYSL